MTNARSDHSVRKQLLPVLSAVLVVVVIALLIGRTDQAFDVVAVIGVAVIVSAAAILRELPQTRTAIDEFAWLIPLIGFGVTILWVGGNASGALGFHEVSAQVIPTLILALAIEAHVFDRESTGERAASGVTALTTLLLLCFGEFQALQSVFRSKPTDAEMVSAAIVAGLLGVLVIAVLGLRPAAGLSRTDANVSAESQSESGELEPGAGDTEASRSPPATDDSSRR